MNKPVQDTMERIRTYGLSCEEFANHWPSIALDVPGSVRDGTMHCCNPVVEIGNGPPYKISLRVVQALLVCYCILASSH